METSFVWGTALEIGDYDVLMMQPFPVKPAQSISAEVAAMQKMIDKQPGAIILVHEGFAPASVVSNGEMIDEEDNGKIRYSQACFEEIVRQLQAANPGREVRRTRTNEAVHLVASDVENGQAVGITEVGGTFGLTDLYRDGLHMNWTRGRYLIHHCIRRSLGITAKRREFPFQNHPTYGSADSETLDYLDTVVDRIFPEAE